MKVCVFSSWFPERKNPLYGIFVKEQVLTLSKKGIQMDVCYLEKAGLNPFVQKEDIKQDNGIQIYRKYIKPLPIRSKMLHKYYVDQYEQIYQIYKSQNGRPDLIHAHNYLSASAALPICKKEQIPLMVTEHASHVLQLNLSGFQNSLCKEVYKKAIRVIAVSNALKASMHKLSPDAHIEVIPNMINEIFAFNKKSTPGTFHLLAIGSLHHNKRFDLLIDGLNTFKIKWPSFNIQLKIIGSGAEKKNLLQQIKKYSLQDNVTIVEEADSMVLKKAYSDAHVLLSTSEAETFGMVALEALASGTLVISTDSGGPSDFINDKNGILLKQANAEEISHALFEILSKYASYNLQKMSKEVLDQYNVDVICDSIIHQYQLIS